MPFIVKLSHGTAQEVTRLGRRRRRGIHTFCVQIVVKLPAAVPICPVQAHQLMHHCKCKKRRPRWRRRWGQPASIHKMISAVCNNNNNDLPAEIVMNIYFTTKEWSRVCGNDRLAIGGVYKTNESCLEFCCGCHPLLIHIDIIIISINKRWYEGADWIGMDYSLSFGDETMIRNIALEHSSNM